MGFLEELTEDSLWQEFLERKKEQKSLSPREEQELADYVKSRRYKKQAEEIRRGAFRKNIGSVKPERTKSVRSMSSPGISDIC